MQNGEGETGDKARPSLYDVGHQVEIQRMIRRQPPLQDTEIDNGILGFVFQLNLINVIVQHVKCSFR